MTRTWSRKLVHPCKHKFPRCGSQHLRRVRLPPKLREVLNKSDPRNRHGRRYPRQKKYDLPAGSYGQNTDREARPNEEGIPPLSFQPRSHKSPSVPRATEAPKSWPYDSPRSEEWCDSCHDGKETKLVAPRKCHRSKHPKDYQRASRLSVLQHSQDHRTPKLHSHQ